MWDCVQKKSILFLQKNQKMNYIHYLPLFGWAFQSANLYAQEDDTSFITYFVELKQYNSSRITNEAIRKVALIDVATDNEIQKNATLSSYFE